LEDKTKELLLKQLDALVEEIRNQEGVPPVSYLFKGVYNKKQLQMLIEEASKALDRISEKPEFKKQEGEVTKPPKIFVQRPRMKKEGIDHLLKFAVKPKPFS
jgi:hypothetical protein